MGILSYWRRLDPIDRRLGLAVGLAAALCISVAEDVGVTGLVVGVLAFHVFLSRCRIQDLEKRLELLGPDPDAESLPSDAAV